MTTTGGTGWGALQSGTMSKPLFPRAATARIRLFACACAVLLASPGFAQERSFDCVMDPAQTIRLAATAPGVLAEIHVSRGAFVQAGQPVAQMDASIERATLLILDARARSNAQVSAQQVRADFVAAQLGRMKQLVEQNAQSAVRLEEMEYENALAQLQLQQALIDRDVQFAEAERARIAVERTIIRSPIDGLVVDVTLGLGESTGTDRAVMTIVQLDPLHVEAFLPIELYAQVQSGMSVNVLPDAPVGGRYRAEIVAVDRVFDTASRTFGVRVALANPEGLLPAGHRCRLSLD